MRARTLQAGVFAKRHLMLPRAFFPVDQISSMRMAAHALKSSKQTNEGVS